MDDTRQSHSGLTVFNAMTKLSDQKLEIAYILSVINTNKLVLVRNLRDDATL